MSTIRIGWYCMVHAILHPRTPIILNPRVINPAPWWGCACILVLGIITWIIGAKLEIVGLSEAARAMVYLPLGNIVGMSISANNLSKSENRKSPPEQPKD